MFLTGCGDFMGGTGGPPGDGADEIIHIIAVKNNQPVPVTVGFDASAGVTGGQVTSGQRREFCCFAPGTALPKVTSSLGPWYEEPGPVVSFTDADSKTAEYAVGWNSISLSGSITCSNCP